MLRAEPQNTLRTSSKHRLAEEESSSEPNKRRRTDHDRDGVGNAGTNESVDSEPGLGQLYKVANMRKASLSPAINCMCAWLTQPSAG